ncbi:glycolipid transfer protein [Fomitiporia mediterranea MF3/22]|uniref:glycolipid transfer protein n=1 Tax=Fomitiporia mediterranea (strain MF3/22) TaxID=694068 RepID=UPI0004409B4A|nr:glycolipid transfer protein [Fomitiporia mediterranea MF3/22]EJD02644.1 glycolipid transfer protein [Fomitiporia mediterranea MF3/22]
MAPFIYFSREDERSFADVTETDIGVDTKEFLEAATGVVRIIELLKSITFKPVLDDLNGNITKVKTRYEAKPEKSATLEELVRNEIAEGSTTATQGLLWLTRGLMFTSGALKACQADATLKLSEAFQSSYGDTLKPFHGFIVKGIFSAAMRVCPTRELLYEDLKKDQDGGPAATQEDLNERLNQWVDALERIVTRIDQFLETNNYKKGL